MPRKWKTCAKQGQNVCGNEPEFCPFEELFSAGDNYYDMLDIACRNNAAKYGLRWPHHRPETKFEMLTEMATTALVQDVHAEAEAQVDEWLVDAMLSWAARQGVAHTVESLPTYEKQVREYVKRETAALRQRLKESHG